MNANVPPDVTDRATISVVIPVYNSGASSVLAIESVLSQTLSVEEIIIVDDGSTDGSAELLKRRFFDRSENVHIYSIENRGAAGARNFGISKATSDWVAFLDSDDIWFPTKLEEQFAELKKNEAIQLIGSLTSMQGFNINPLQSKRLKIVSFRTLLFKNYFQTSTVVIRRKVFAKLGGFPEGRRYAEEGDMFMRIAAEYTCALLNKVLVDYAGGKSGFGVAGLSANLWRMEHGELDNIRRTFYRGDSGVFITGLAISFSLIKFLRRIFISYMRKIYSKA